MQRLLLESHRGTVDGQSALLEHVGMQTVKN
jgi:hypothetical protein